MSKPKNRKYYLLYYGTGAICLIIMIPFLIISGVNLFVIYMALVLIYDDPVSAKQGVTTLEQKVKAYNELCEWISRSKDAQIYDTEIRFENEVLLAKLYSDQIGLWRWWLFDQWWLIHI